MRLFGITLTIISYFYLLVTTVALSLMGSNSIQLLFISILFVWSIQKRLELKITYSIIIISIGYISGLPDEQAIIIQIILSIFIVLTDYEEVKNNNIKHIEKNNYILALQGKYNTLIDRLIV